MPFALTDTLRAIWTQHGGGRTSTCPSARSPATPRRRCPRRSAGTGSFAGFGLLGGRERSTTRVGWRSERAALTEVDCPRRAKCSKRLRGRFEYRARMRSGRDIPPTRGAPTPLPASMVLRACWKRARSGSHYVGGAGGRAGSVRERWRNIRQGRGRLRQIGRTICRTRSRSHPATIGESFVSKQCRATRLAPTRAGFTGRTPTRYVT